MNTVKATWKNGQVVPDVRVNWPDGCRLTIEPIAETTPTDHDGPMTPAEIAQTLADMEKVQPFEMTDEERAGIEAWKKIVKDCTIATMHNDPMAIQP